MSKTLILHVGTHKTGTTAIQRTLERNGDALAGAGLVFPVFDTRFRHTPACRNAHFIDAAISRACGVEEISPPEGNVMRRVGKCERELTPFVDGPLDVVMSEERLWRDAAGCEPFWPRARDYLEGLGFDDFRIIVYLRRQDKFAEALWNQQVKNFVKLGCALEDYLADEKILATCDYAGGLAALAKTFGKDGVCVRLFDRARFVGGDVVPDFLQAVTGRDDIEVAALKGDANERLSNDMVEIKRRVNANPQARSRGNFLLGIAHAVTEEQPESLRTNILPPVARESFLARFAVGNAWVAREFFGREDGVLFGSEKSDSYALWNPGGPSMLASSLRTVDLLAEKYAAKAAECRQLREQLDAAERMAQPEPAPAAQHGRFRRAAAAFKREWRA